MKRAPIFSKDENGKFNELAYDPRIDFSKFVEEARKHANNAKIESPVHSHEPTTAAGIQKSKRSLKNTLFFWRKFATKEAGSHEGMTTNASSTDLNASNRRTAPVSGELPRRKDRAGVGHRVGLAASGPLAGWFTPTRAEETQIPYMSLDQQTHTSGVKAFGPIYRVT